MSSLFTIRTRLHLGLTLAGALAGAVAGAALTPIGKAVAGAPPATFENYLWNMCAFGLLAAIASPLVTWSAFRRVPLWRTVVEPMAGAILGAGVGLALGSGAAFLLLAPLGLVAAMGRLARRYRTPDDARLTAGGSVRRAAG